MGTSHWGGLHLLLILTLTLTFFATGLQIAGMFALRIFVRNRKPKPLASRLGPGQKAPGVTILRPCHLADDNEIENFIGFYQQDYPGPVEILYLVRDLSVPCVPVIQEYLKRYPHIDAKLVTPSRFESIWKKVDSLAEGHRRARYDRVIWTDSDLVVGPSFVSDVVSALEEPGVSVVTVPQYEFRADGFWTGMRALGNNTDIGTLVMLQAVCHDRQSAAWGQTLAYRRTEFDALGGESLWAEMGGMLADDQAMAHFYARAGRRVVWRAIWGPVEFARKSLKSVWNQKARWTVVQVAALRNPVAFASGVFVTNPLVMAGLAWAVLGGVGLAGLGAATFAGALAARMAAAAVFERGLIREFRIWPRWFWTLPFYDAAQVVFVLYGLFKRTIDFNGVAYRVKNRFYLEPAGRGRGAESGPLVAGRSRSKAPKSIKKIDSPRSPRA